MFRMRVLAAVQAAALTAAGLVQPAEVASAPPSDHWAWKAPARPPVPEVGDPEWRANPIDRFVRAAQERKGVEPAAEASPEELIRRVAFGLTGLPPDPEEVDDFLADRAPGAWERLIDRLLASPRYGERWGRHWLDLARYADSNGFEHDEPRPDAWRYRDYAIEAFNADKPYDRFIEEQLAGDELFPGSVEPLIATGFNLLGPDMTDSADQKLRRLNTLNDMTDTAGLVFLALTIGCARCHDHKFEPIPQADYYRLQAHFSPTEFRSDLPIATPADLAAHEAAAKTYSSLVGPIEKEIARIEEPYRVRLREEKLSKIADEAQFAHRTPEKERTTAQREIADKTARLLAVSKDELEKAMTEPDRSRRRGLDEEMKRFEPQRPAPLPVALGLRVAAAPARTFLLDRGEIDSPREEVHAGFPRLITAAAEATLPEARAAPRSPLARWIASGRNPLTARVMANRIWQRHFGEGLVATASDFGLRGARPTHPELLDWLAVQFIDRGWSIKSIQRLILTSRTYRMSSRIAPTSGRESGAAAQGPENRLLTRQRRVRLDGEAIRDGLLAAGSQLNVAMGGPGVFPPVPAEAVEGTSGWKASADPRDHTRRSVYLFVRRNLRFPFLEAFDLPDTNQSCARRERTNTAPQALALLNARETFDAAEALALRLDRTAGSDGERIAFAYRLLFSRLPAASEVAAARDFLSGSSWNEFCRALFNSSEFIHVD